MGRGARSGGGARRGDPTSRAQRRLAIGIAVSLAFHLALLLLPASRGRAQQVVAQGAAVLVELVRPPPRVEPPPRPRLRPEPTRRVDSPRRAAHAAPSQLLIDPIAPSEPPRPEPERLAREVDRELPPVPSPRELALSLSLPLDEEAEIEARIDDDLSRALAQGGGGDGRCVQSPGGWWCPPGLAGPGGGGARSEALRTGVDLYCW